MFMLRRRPRMVESAPEKYLATALQQQALKLPEDTLQGDIEEALERWLNPQTVGRALVKAALAEMDKHRWGIRPTPMGSRMSGTCGTCGTQLTPDNEPRYLAMRAHQEDILARMLGLTIRPESLPEDDA